MADARPRIAVILAAGKGTRMRSDRPKVLHAVAGHPMLERVVTAARQAECGEILVVVGHQAERVQRTLDAPDLDWVLQREQRGTGHALAQVADRVRGEALLLVLSGDVPLVKPQTLERLASACERSWGAMAVAELEEPGSLGRVEVDARGFLARIVEAADATAEELANRRVNAGIYALPAPEIFEHLTDLSADNAKGELYLTDALSAAVERRDREVAIMELADPDEALGVNDRRDLARVHRRLIGEKLQRLMEAGVTVLEPERTVVEPEVRVGPDTVLHPGVSLIGSTSVGRGSVLHQGVWVRDSILAEEVTVEAYSVLDGGEVGRGCRVGPFARLRPGALVMDGARVGNFVEVKNSRLGAGAKVNHLAYLGDASVGEGANVGAGVVTCNYDGREKHRTEIGPGAFVGSDTMLVAPVEVGEGAVTAAGSVITHDVPPGALGVGRARQRNVESWSERRGRRQETAKEEEQE